MKIVITILGVVAGSILGYYAGQHFPFWGGLNTLGEPYSPARDVLGRNHALAFGVIGGLAALGSTFLLSAKEKKPRPSARDRVTPEPTFDCSGTTPPPFRTETVALRRDITTNPDGKSALTLAIAIGSVALVAGALVAVDYAYYNGYSAKSTTIEGKEYPVIDEQLVDRSGFESDRNYELRREQKSRGQAAVLHAIGSYSAAKQGESLGNRRPLDRPGSRIDDRTARARLNPEMLEPVTGGGGLASPSN